MKKNVCHTILSFILLFSIGAACISENVLVYEKEKYELEDTLEELGKEKASSDYELGGINSASYAQFQFSGLHLISAHYHNVPFSFNSHSVEKYILHCSLKLFC